MFLPVAAALALTAAAEAAAPKPNIIFVLAGEPLPEKPSSQDGIVGSVAVRLLGSALRLRLATRRTSPARARTDDLNWDYKQDRQALMPNLRKQFVEGGLYFHNHVAACAQCLLAASPAAH